MNRIDFHAKSILRFLDQVFGEAKPESEQIGPQQMREVIPQGGEPQPVCRILDKSEDIAQEYSHTPPPPRPKLAVMKSPLAFMTVEVQLCETSERTYYAEIDCDELAIGQCKHCHMWVGKLCLKHGYCLSGPLCRHEVDMQ